MIAKLRGLVESIAANNAVIDVGGVGYLVFCSSRTLSRLPTSGGEATLLVHTEVREDAITLYGFFNGEERDWFRLLTTVQGVGSRVGIAILSAMAPEEVSRAILAQDKATMTRADGVGPKLATRILSELKDKVAGLGFSGGDPIQAPVAMNATNAASGGGGILADAVSALTNLGYGRAEAHGAVGRAAQALGDKPDVSALIAASLKELSQ